MRGQGSVRALVDGHEWELRSLDSPPECRHLKCRKVEKIILSRIESFGSVPAAVLLLATTDRLIRSAVGVAFAFHRLRLGPFVGSGTESLRLRRRTIPGRGGGIRTPDPLLPKQMRYQTALRPEVTTDLLDFAPKLTGLLARTRSPTLISLSNHGAPHLLARADTAGKGVR